MSTSPVASPWILGPWRDALLFYATPLLILPAVLLLRLGMESRDIQYLVLALGSLGHNLPGMLRAYGDRELFQRFRARFVWSPVVFTVVVVALSLRGGDGLVLLLFLWSVWHALMQHYGFLRIYDAKVGAIASRDARIDFWICVVGFLGLVLCADHRLDYVQSALAGFGVPPLAPALVAALRLATGLALGLLGAIYVGLQLARVRRGEPVSLPKNLCLVIGLGFWWYANATFADVLVGIVLFEIYHDVQYLAIVWLFHRRRVEGGASVGSFTRFLFRRSYGLMALYVGLCFAYGLLLPVSRAVADAGVDAQLASAVVTISGLMHFYFDGFIWKVREESTRRGLGLQSAGRADLVVPRHAWKWLAFLVPAGAFFALGDRPIELPLAQALAASTPQAASAEARLGNALVRAGNFADAVPAYEQALALSGAPEGTEHNAQLARIDAARAALRADDLQAARRFLDAARAVAPGLMVELHDHAYGLWQLGALEEAIVDYRCAILLDSEQPIPHLNLALAYRDAGRKDLALAHARKGAALAPQNERAQLLVRELQR